MNTEKMISELRMLEEKYRHHKFDTYETNWFLVCKSVADRLEELLEYKHMYEDLCK